MLHPVGGRRYGRAGWPHRFGDRRQQRHRLPSGAGTGPPRCLRAAGRRDPGRGRAARTAIVAELPAASVELVQLDLADLDSVARLADQLLDRAGGLDLLINNAGVMAVPRRRTTAQGFELQFGTNHLGHFALTVRLLPGLVPPPGQPGGDGQQPGPPAGLHPAG